jgi:hypothetical protein
VRRQLVFVDALGPADGLRDGDEEVVRLKKNNNKDDDVPLESRGRVGVEAQGSCDRRVEGLPSRRGLSIYLGGGRDSYTSRAKDRATTPPLHSTSFSLNAVMRSRAVKKQNANTAGHICL